MPEFAAKVASIKTNMDNGENYAANFADLNEFYRTNMPLCAISFGITLFRGAVFITGFVAVQTLCLEPDYVF